MREYSKESVQKDHGQWKAVISWQDGARQRKRSKATGIRCYPDTRDKSGRIKKRDNRGKAAAEEFLRKWRDELIEAESKKSEEESTPARANGTPLYDYAKAYYEMHHVKPSTKAGYHAALVRLAGTEAGATALGDLSATTFYRWEQSLYEDGLSENTVAHYHAFLAQVLKHAVGEGDIPRSPLGHMRAPRRRPKPVNSLTRAGAAAVIGELKGLGTSPISVAALIALSTGMRRAEVCALRWLDVNLEGRVIHVRHSLVKGGGFSLDTPKDPSGGNAMRYIEVGDGLARLLSAAKSRMAGEAKEMGVPWNDSLYVVGPVTGGWKSPDTLSREWSTLARLRGWRGTQGETVRFHDLRHTFATLAIADSMDVMALASVLGHRDVTTTLNVYATVLADARRAGMERMDALVFLG